MKKKILIFLILVLLLSIGNTFGQWTKINSVPSVNIVALAVNNNIIYAVSGTNKIYTSSDAGVNWNELTVSANPADLTSITFFNNNIYAGTFTHGVFKSSDNGITWQNNSSNPLFISDFAVKDNALYASTLGNGVAVLNTIANTWSFINDSLPTFSVTVQSITSSPDYLMIAAGSNGIFYKYDFNGNYWVEGYYYGILKPGLQIDNLISNADTIFAVSGNKIIRSNDAGATWADDTSGTQNGARRNIYAGETNHYTLTNLAPVGTWIQHRDRYAGTGTSWASDEEFLPDGFSFDIAEYNQELFLAKNDGLYFKSIVTEVKENKVNSSFKFYVYPNPSPGGAINVESEKNIVSLEVFNIIGEVVYRTEVNRQHFQINSYLPNGIYFVRLNLKDEIRTSKLIILK
jgi:photosystem II stability/assembly factor-like uncharacterized protein